MNPDFSRLDPKRPILVGISGGPDSVCLLHLLHRAGFACRGVHINHQLRGDDSEADETLVRSCCAALRIPLHIHRERPVPRPSVSLEMAGRALRHRVFRSQLAGGNPPQAVALGHHEDDNLETILMRRERQPEDPRWNMQADVTITRQGQALRLVRPLLAVSKREILNWLAAQGIPYHIDASNTDTTFTRNRIRHKELPHLDTRARQALIQDAHQQRLADETASTLAMGLWESKPDRLDTARLLAQPFAVRRKIAIAWLGHEHAAHATRLANGQWNFMLNPRTRVSHQGGRLVLQTLPDGVAVPPPRPLSIPGTSRWGAWELHLEATRGFVRERRPYEAWVQPGEFRVRAWRAGDRMRPFGMTGTRKVQDILTDMKIPAHEKRMWPVVVDTDEAIVWIPGFRIASSHAVDTDEASSLHLKGSRPNELPSEASDDIRQRSKPNR